MRFMDVRALELGGIPAVVSRSGYTGEDGFEISVAADATPRTSPSGCWRSTEVLPVGLGARDLLRLEAGLCLYGHDIDETTTPVEAALEWAIQPARRPRRRAGGRLSRGRRDPRPDRRRASRGAGSGCCPRAGRRCARGSSSSPRRRGDAVGRDHLGRLRAEPRRAGRHGLRADRARGAGDAAARPVAREDAACNSGATAVHQARLQAGVTRDTESTDAEIHRGARVAAARTATR